MWEAGDGAAACRVGAAWSVASFLEVDGVAAAAVGPSISRASALRFSPLGLASEVDVVVGTNTEAIAASAISSAAYSLAPEGEDENARKGDEDC